MPVANLQSYRTVALRVHSSSAEAQGLTATLESSVLGRLRQSCGFAQVGAVGETPADVVLDLDITRVSRGGDGWIKVENQVVVDTLLVLSDGQAGDLLGTATIHGKSSGTVINNAPQENEAIDVIAKTVAELLAKSGCSGPRVARAPVPAPDTGSASQGSAAPVVDEAKRAEAEGLNDKGKERLFAADTAGALVLFQQAMTVLPDPKYQFNVCVALGAQEKWDAAIAACKQARSMNPSESLAGKIDARLDALQHRQ
jgi:hypothetical protein